jgi:hypothetical protein
MSGDMSRPPASNNNTLELGSCESLAASTHPALPPPTMM